MEYLSAERIYLRSAELPRIYREIGLETQLFQEFHWIPTIFHRDLWEKKSCSPSELYHESVATDHNVVRKIILIRFQQCRRSQYGYLYSTIVSFSVSKPREPWIVTSGLRREHQCILQWIDRSRIPYASFQRSLGICVDGHEYAARFIE